MEDRLLGEETALIIVDVQNCFVPGGALPTPGGHEVVEPLNRYAELVVQAGGKVFASRDWHPKDHMSFQSRGGPWPPHCVQGTEGAGLHPKLRLPEGAQIVSKGYDPDDEDYSAFDNTGLDDMLKQAGIKRVLVGGLATDYCVKETVLDALENGYETYLLLDAISGVEAQPGDVKRAVQEMLNRGAKTARLSSLERELEAEG
ncbi:MAG: nicotinamidase [Anaerolineae bacterium]|nr:nicotinamidase [Anaerolineae bacterium]